MEEKKKEVERKSTLGERMNFNTKPIITPPKKRREQASSEKEII